MSVESDKARVEEFMDDLRDLSFRDMPPQYNLVAIAFHDDASIDKDVYYVTPATAESDDSAIKELIGFAENYPRNQSNKRLHRCKERKPRRLRET